MDFNGLENIKAHGFVGFMTMQDLFADSSHLPAIKGIYLILRTDTEPPSFLTTGTGARFKGKDPNVDIEELKANWISRASVIYIGKAGSDSSKATLRSRLKQYFGFGQGKNIGHWGGRFIWQLESSGKLIVCWKALPNSNPRTEESQLIQKFVSQFGNRPFANLKD